jgi:hypothetical protein
MAMTWGPGKLVATLATLILSTATTGAFAQTPSDAKTDPPDSCDFRLLETNSVQPAPLWAALLKALAPRYRDLAASLSSKAPDESLLRKTIEKAMAPGGATNVDRDLLLLTGDQWLRYRGDSGLPTTFDDELEPAWGKLGFRAHGEATSSYYSYCGSILPTIAASAGKDEWADRALLLLLDQGWVTDCSGVFEGTESDKELYVPVIAHGEDFLAQHLGSSVWGAVALRVAMAHETAWSLAKAGREDKAAGREEGRDDKDPSATSKHRDRALLLYRELAKSATDPRMRVGLQARARALEANRDTGCRVYYVAGDD